MLTEIYVGQYVNSNDTEPSPMINSRESKLLRDTFQCHDKIYGGVGDVLEIIQDSKSASLIDPLTLIIKTEDLPEAELFATDISTAINEDQDPDKQIVFKRVKELQDGSKPVTINYMDHFEEKLNKKSAKESKSSKDFAIRLALITTFGGLGGGFALSYLLQLR